MRLAVGSNTAAVAADSSAWQWANIDFATFGRAAATASLSVLSIWQRKSIQFIMI